MTCTHKVFSDFVVGVLPDGREQLQCSKCGRLFVWIDGKTSYFGNIECGECWRASVEKVLCDTCAAIREAK